MGNKNMLPGWPDPAKKDDSGDEKENEKENKEPVKEDFKIDIEEMKELADFMENMKLNVDDVLDLIRKFSNNKRITINYKNTLQKALDYTGKEIDPMINEENFPIPAELKDKSVRILTKLFTPNLGSEYSSDLIKRMKEEGCRPATVMELASLYPRLSDYHKRFRIYTTESTLKRNSDGVPLFPQIHGHEMYLVRDGGYFNSNDLVLGVFEEPTEPEEQKTTK